ncbi:MAG: hypothetical protein ACR2HC_00140 [Thermoleophilaceae bacterium]
MAGAALLLLGLIVGFALSFLLGVVLILASLAAFGYQATQSIKAARERESADDDSSADSASSADYD